MPAYSSSASYSGPNLSTTQSYGAQRGLNGVPTTPRGVYDQITPQGEVLRQFSGQQGQLFGSQGGQNIASGATSGAQGYGAELANMGRSIQGQFAGNQGYANAALRQAFDPQKKLYKQYQSDLLDSTNSQEALRGIANTPYGASISSNAMGRFINDWQDRQVDRRLTGSQTATGLQNQLLASQLGGGNLINQAGQLNLGAAEELLKGYGIDSENMRSALRDLSSVFSNLNVSKSASSSGSSGGGY